MIAKLLFKSSTSLFIFFTLINLLNYLDRGIIPGASNEFQNFIEDSLHTSHPSSLYGLLTSSFIAGYSVASVIFGHIVHKYPKFKIIGFGMSIWCVAVFLSGLSKPTGSYYFLLFSRMLSGVGEASFQCIAPPYISDHGGKSKGLWLAIFYTAISVGTATGFAYSSLIAECIGWDFAFYIECLLMIPMALLCFTIPDDIALNFVSNDETSTNFIENADQIRTKDSINSNLKKMNSHDESTEVKNDISFQDEFFLIIKRPVFVCLTLGYAAYTAVFMGFTSFGANFLMGLGIFNKESVASTTFGAIISVVGIIGTPVGGWLIDRATKKLNKSSSSSPILDDNDDSTEEDREISEEELLKISTDEKIDNYSVLCKISWLLFVLMTFATAFLLAAGIVSTELSGVVYLLLVAIGCFFAFVCTAGINLSIMLSVPEENRSFAIALETLGIHALGDVPSPVIIGALKDSLAPECTSNDDGSIKDECSSQQNGLRATIVIVTAWMIWTVLFFLLAFFFAKRRRHQIKRSIRHLSAIPNSVRELQNPLLNSP